jgi:hypothetical protein
MMCTSWIRPPCGVARRERISDAPAGALRTDATRQAIGVRRSGSRVTHESDRSKEMRARNRDPRVGSRTCPSPIAGTQRKRGGAYARTKMVTLCTHAHRIHVDMSASRHRPSRMTAEDLFHYDMPGKRTELVRGRLVVRDLVGVRHAVVVAKLVTALSIWLARHPGTSVTVHSRNRGTLVTVHSGNLGERQQGSVAVVAVQNESLDPNPIRTTRSGIPPGTYVAQCPE